MRSSTNVPWCMILIAMEQQFSDLTPRRQGANRLNTSGCYILAWDVVQSREVVQRSDAKTQGT